MPTIKQNRAVSAVVENGGNVSKAMKKVGYSKAMAKNPQKLTRSKGFKEAAKPLLKRLADERDEALKAMKSKRSGAKYRDLVDSVDKLTKNIQLLSGKPTESVRNEVELTDEQQTRLAKEILYGHKSNGKAAK